MTESPRIHIEMEESPCSGGARHGQAPSTSQEDARAYAEELAEIQAELASIGVDPSGVMAQSYAAEKDAVPTVAAETEAEKVVRGNGRLKRFNEGETVETLKTGKPSWLRVKAPQSQEYHNLVGEVKARGLFTVCQEAACPNIGDCWSAGHLTVMILGDTCTRGCAFCNIKTGRPNPVNPHEPEELADMASQLSLKHMVITSVDRDDQPDGGAHHWAKCVRLVKERCPGMTVEILTPDFRRKEENIDVVADSLPDVFNHNLETVPRLYREVRPGARYFGSLRLLQRVKERHPTMFTKSGIMVGLGESRDEVLQVMDDMRSAGVDFITIGQYLRPTPKHYPLRAYITPEEFADYERQAKLRGFLMVASGPLVRSSYHADRYFAELVEQRERGEV